MCMIGVHDTWHHFPRVQGHAGIISATAAVTMRSAGSRA